MDIEYGDIDAMCALFQKRADNMVNDAVSDATTFAQGEAGARQAHPGKMNRPIRRRKQVLTVASGFLIARWVEKIMYQRLTDFFGAW